MEELNGSSSFKGKDSLASRLYSDKGLKRAALVPQLKQGGTSLRAKTQTLQMSSSAPTLKTINTNIKNTTLSSNLGKSLTLNRSKKSEIQGRIDSEVLNNTGPVQDTGNMTFEPIPKTFLESINLSEKEMSDLMNIPNTFYYLCPQKRSDTKFYDLELVAQDKIDPDHYYTISKEGVTQYRMKQTQFTTLVQWEREFRLFHRISRIPFFRQYRCWKSFTTWKRGLRFGKVKMASQHLAADLFLFNPPLRVALLSVRQMCSELGSQSLLQLTNEVSRLEDFVKAQNAIHILMKGKIEELSASVLMTVRAACDQVVDEFLKANNIVANHKMTFMERASLRSECRRLTRFLRLVDIMMANFLKTLMLDTINKLVAATESLSLIPQIEVGSQSSDLDMKAVVKRRIELKTQTPLFRLGVNFHKKEPDPSDAIVMEEAMIITPSLDHLTKTVDGLIYDALHVVGAVKKVFDSPETEMFVMPESEEEEDSTGEASDLVASIKTSALFVQAKDTVHKQLRLAYGAVRTYIEVFEPFRQTFFANLRYERNVSTILENGTVDSFVEAISEFKNQIIRFADIPKFADVGVFFVDSDTMKAELRPSPTSCLLAIKSWLPQLIYNCSHQLLDIVGGMNPIIAGDPNSVEAYVNKKKTKDKAVGDMESYRSQKAYLLELQRVMEDNEWPVNDDVKAQLRMLKEGIYNLETNIQTSDGKEDEEVKRFSSQIAEEVPKVMKSVLSLREQLDSGMIGNPDMPDEKVLKFLGQQEVDYTKLKDRVDRLQDYQTILKLPVDEFEVLGEVGADLSLKLRLWKDKADWASLRDQVLSTGVSQLDVNFLEKELVRFNKTVALASKGLPANKVVPKLKASVDELNPVLPVVVDLRNPALQDRHWEKIQDLTKVDIRNATNFSLQDLISFGITAYQQDISAIATAAQQEAILEEMMGKVTSLWTETNFEVKPYKDIKDLYIMGDVSEVIANLDDSLVTINTVLGSRYVAGIRHYVDTWRSKLMLFQETLDEWLTCQRNWMYLETIFSSPDIMRQLPASAKTFQIVDKSWKMIMKQTFDEPNALNAATKDKNRRDLFKSHNANLDQIQKELEEYLETKRMAFPRFYFLSNDELLEILSQAKDAQAVQPHLRKCFDNLIKLEFGKEESSVDIIAMFSGENERVALGKNLKARGNVEAWLKDVESRMKDSLHACMKLGYQDYDTKPRDEWIFHHPGQIVATVAQMTWARGTEAALRSSDPVGNILVWFAEYKEELQKLIIKIRGNLTKLMRYIIVALVTTDVHARDIIDELIERKVSSTQDFLWQQQLRYYWELDASNSEDCIIKHSDAKVKYGYEYMGATSRLVITPLTDRCWLTLTGSYALKLGAAPAGPAGTGKTESSKDLAKAMGIQCVVFNCSDQIDYKMMGKLFRGLAQGGAWVCLDEFNRIDIEVLSVIAQQLLVLREGRVRRLPTINFMGHQIPLIDHHVIITMNPGYAGRTELPDNLAVCFRPVSMMVPNYALIAEIMLFAEGFGDAKTLSQKMCKLYILCSEQLSQQPHYDYGLRAVKSVLVMAGSLKRANPNTAEDLVLIRALRDSNVPKFLADDLPLFAAIVQDLFPGVVIPSNDYGELQVALEEELDKAGLQKVPKYIGKIIQMFDIFNIRFGGTLVGPAGTGKTTCYRILAALMTNLREKGSTNPEFQRVVYKVFNPKCISMGELYGEFNPMTQEWHDGLASTIMREFVAEEGDHKRWTVFDGPIDALWIENMNTVLDDNMTLCLANGQRIKLKWEMKCLFEVMDLAVASPATVSRIGVVYLTPSDLGWMPYVISWTQRALPAGCPDFVGPHIVSLFDKIVTKGLTFQRKKCKEPVETVDIQLVISLCTLFESLFKPSEQAPAIRMDAQTADLKQVVEKLFFFSFVWSIGAPCASGFWSSFSDYTREIFEEACPTLGVPAANLVFDYFVDVKETESRFREWTEIVPAFVYDDNAPYFSLMVPTADTVRFSFVMKTLITVDKPCFITGVTGTGKTVAVQNLLVSQSPTVHDGGMGLVPVFVNFSAQTQSIVVQTTIESKLEKKRKNLLGATAGRKVVIFVDDINMPLVESYGAQPPIELLRQFLDNKGFYDRDKLFWKDVTDVLLFAGAAPPEGGRAKVTPRFTRHFNVLCMPPASEAALALIFSSILSGFLSKFDPVVQRLSSGIVSATTEIYFKISEELLPTPAKFHYQFNLRDISKVFQGVLMIRPRRCSSLETFARLWIHETSRVFCDRLINVDDMRWFEKTIVELSNRHLKYQIREEDFLGKPIVFADFLRPDVEPKERFYEEIKDLPKLTTILGDLLDDYNVSFPTQMNLVFFLDALLHTTRISRILRQPRGNAMLIGVGGSGKQSLTKMASFVAGMSCLSIEINRGYGIKEFREDMKKFMLKTGVEGKDTVFLFTDSQIVDETMLEDLNNVLNTGDIPNLFPADETDRIVSDMISVCKEAGIAETRDNCLAYFVSRVRDKLHIVLGMSPVGDSLRVRCRQFPSLINCTTIDWYHGWPEAALVSVAERFLMDLELPSEEVRAAVVQMCGFVHRSIEQFSVRFFNELRRRIYTTPKSYLDLISLYMNMLKGLQDAVETRAERMRVGVRKLNETNSLVDGLREELVKLEPVLQVKSVETGQLLERVAKDSAAAATVAEKVGAEEALVGKQATETAAIAEDAQRDLDKALPALNSAVKALASLTKADITEVKSFAKPPPVVQIVMEAICCMLGEKDGWDISKKLLSRTDFMELLTGYDKDNIPEARLKKLRKDYIDREEMKPDVVKNVSKAGLGLCLWVHAMNVYADVAKEVAPKKAKLEEMKAKLDSANKILGEKQAQLKAVQDNVAALQSLCDNTLAQKNALQQEMNLTAARLVRAEKLTSGLNSEGVRWKQTIEVLRHEKANLVGDCFLSCACISYYGGFTGTYRDELVHMWLEQATHLSIPASINDYSLAKTLGDPVQIREWQNQGLPTDAVSVNNGILVSKCRRWPLMIDPQQQANKWIRKMEESFDLAITTMRDGNLLRTLENCIRIGKPLLIEDVGEQIEPALEPVLLKSVFKQGTRLLIRLGDSDVDYDAAFKLYMTTKMPNPHYLPEVCIKVTLINFTVTMDGLEAQLLGDVVRAERPDIEAKKIQLMLQMAADKKQLAELEAKILQMLSESEGNILDDEKLINTLSDSKTTSISIGERVAEAEITEKEINSTREKYLRVATRGSIIYFVIADLAGIDPMYQYSLAYYAQLFNRCLLDSEKSTNLETRLDNILSYSTLTIYQNICRGLFEKDKLLFSSTICFQILRNAGEILDVEWNLFLRGPGSLDRTGQPTNPFPEEIPALLWDLLYAMEQRLHFKVPEEEKPAAAAEAQEATQESKDGKKKSHKANHTEEVLELHRHSHPHPMAQLCESLVTSREAWVAWSKSSDPLTAPLPEPLTDTVNLFQRLLLVKALKEDRLLNSIARYVGLRLGRKFADSPSASMEEVYADLDNKTPCIFILSTGADPTGMLLRFAYKSGFGDRLHIVSLGQGQGPYAKSLIEKGTKTGDWVVLQNCMLAKSWMSELDRIIFDIQERVKNDPDGTAVHESFRLYLTSAPASYFPVAVLQNGVKMTNEPPKGLRANLLRSFGNLVKPEDWDGLKGPKEAQWKKLLCALAFFHGNIQERRKFGPLGWNIRYAFDESDLETSIAVLRRFLMEQDVLPWDALLYVTGQINYGGRVTDDMDRRCLMAVLSIHMRPDVIVDGYSFSKSGTYYPPKAGSLEETLEYFETLPLTDDPEVFGMHENANVTFNTNESLSLMSTLLSLQPRSSGGGSGKSSDEIVLDIAAGLEKQCPEPMDMDDAGPTTFIVQANGILPSLAICLVQEIVKFNRLLSTMTATLNYLKRAIRGMAIMSEEMDKMYSALLNNQLPPNWERVSFASLKTLASWAADLVYRIAFMRKWLKDGQPNAFPMPVFFFPQAIDTLSFEFEILLHEPEELNEGPDDGVYIFGLYMEGARFDRKLGRMEESEPGRMYDLLPVIHFKPAVGHKQAPGTYACPVYKTAVRKGVLSTTGMSTNYVLPVELPTDVPEEKWILAGVAALCNLTD